MDENDPIFSHQIEAVRSLSLNFEKISVITSRIGNEIVVPANVEVILCRWIQGRTFENVFRFFITVARTFSTAKPDVIFSHMTEVQSSLLSLFTRVMRIPHFLWYAHASKSFYLRICSVLCTGIVSSTSGSCPVNGSKVYLIGQAIDSDQFYFSKHKSSWSKFVHVGRFDPSKKIDEIVQTIFADKNRMKSITFTQIGDPSSNIHTNYKKETAIRFKDLLDKDIVYFKHSVARNELPLILGKYDVFIHAFEGSLDKTLIEATMSGLPVITVNSEYRKIFGSWSDNQFVDLKSELDAFLLLTKEAHVIEREILQRRAISVKMHSQAIWIDNLTGILKSS
jgi:glycosyltransferase involved in cell wall biosynthesis